MSDLYDDIARGCLKNGEPIDARWGAGWWSETQQQQPEPEGGQCPYCGGQAWYFDGEFIECENGCKKLESEE